MSVDPNFSLYPKRKLSNDGTFNCFPGNSVVCMLIKDVPFYRKCEECFNLLKNSSISKHFSFLDVQYLHVTIFDLLCDYNRNPSRWLPNLSLEDNFMEVEKRIICLTKSIFSDPHIINSEFSFRFSKISFIPDQTFAIELIAEPEDVTRIQNFQNLLSNQTGLSVPKKSLHITLAYQNISLQDNQNDALQNLVQEMENIFNDGTIAKLYPTLVFFRDMTQMLSVPLYTENLNFMDYINNRQYINKKMVIVVLGHIYSGSEIFIENRLKKAIVSYYQHKLTYQTVRILLSGGQPLNDFLSQAEFMNDWIKPWGIDESDIILEKRSQSTIEAILFIEQILSKKYKKKKKLK